MALSEEEQRLLAQLEASLTADDPKLAQTLGSHTPRRIQGRRATMAGLLFLIAGLQTSWVVSVAGFLAMFVATIVAIITWQKVTEASGRPRPATQTTSEPFMGRMEDRWRRRQEGDL